MAHPASTTARRCPLPLAAFACACLAGLPTPSSAGTANADTMRAVRYHEYGTTSVLRLERVPRPVPTDEQVLVQVHAAAANPLDWHYMRGTPYIMRLDSGWSAPKDPFLGADMAGRVVAVGRKVTRFKPGDAVFGTGASAFAEYSVASEKRLAAIPANVSFEQAAALPVAALTALQGLRDEGRLEPGQRVLINGASGGVGTFAVQLAKVLGADVTGVCSGRNAERVRALGADRVIDYTQADFTTGPERYDLVLDLVGNRGLLDVRRVLKPAGRHVLIGGGGPDNGRWLGPIAKVVQGYLLSPFVEQEFGMMLAQVRTDDLAYVAQLVRDGKVVPVIDRRYPLERTADAIEYLETGRARGKVIVTVAP